MRHGERLDSTDMSWRLKTDRPYDTPITERGKTEARHISLKRYSDKVHYIICTCIFIIIYYFLEY